MSDSNTNASLDAAELPFLVTHWLSNYNASNNNNENNNDEAVQRIRQAAADLGAAFRDLGAFGITHAVSRSC